MNRIQTKRALAALLALSILVLGGLASAQCLITQETHHAHHQEGTHGTVLCSWMCAVGQVLYGNATPCLIEQQPVILSDNIQFLFIPHTALDSATSRGPPFHSTT